MGRSQRIQLAVFLVAVAVASVHGDQPCALRSFGTNKFVCVCNATYCDTINPVGDIPKGQYVLYTSSKAGQRFEKSTGELNAKNESGIIFQINPNDQQQTIIGFGGAFTDSTGINILSLSEKTQDFLLKSYYSSEGIEFTMGRVPIGGTDFSTHIYTYDDETGDDDLSEFHLAEEDGKYKIPIIKRAMTMSSKPIKLLSAAWSPPIWMKTNNAITGFGFLKEEYYDTWAKYHVKFLDAYKKEGLTFWGMSTGNEPSNGIIPFAQFNSLGWTPQTQSKWVAENLGPAIRGSEHKDLKLLALDDQRFMLPWWIDIMMQNEKTKEYIDGIAIHWYWDNLLPANLVTATHNHFPEKFIISTEACKGDRPWNYPKVDLGSWSRAEDYIGDIIQDTNHWVSGWVDWNLALNKKGGPTWVSNFVDSAVIVNPEADEFFKQPIFYALGHVTKFVPEGSKHIKISPTYKKNVYLTAFLTPEDRVVVVMYNRGNTDREVTLKVGDRGSVTYNVQKRSFNTVLL